MSRRRWRLRQRKPPVGGPNHWIMLRADTPQVSLRTFSFGVAYAVALLATCFAVPVAVANLVMFFATLLIGALTAVSIVYGRRFTRAFAVGASLPLGILVIELISVVHDLPLTTEQLNWLWSGLPPNPDPF